MTQNLLSDLPGLDTRRWSSCRKGAVAQAIIDKRITMEDAADRYDLSIEELRVWIHRFALHGHRALRATRAQDYRPRP